MVQCGTWETGEEIQITYPKEQRILYDKKDNSCIYSQFERQVGINKGNFVEMVAKEYFEDQGYNVESHYYLKILFPLIQKILCPVFIARVATKVRFVIQ